MDTNQDGRKVDAEGKKREKGLRGWWRRNRSRGAGLTKRRRKWVAILLWLTILLLPGLTKYCLFEFRTLLALQELKRDSNLAYHLGQRLSEEELEENFEFNITKYKQLNYYSLKKPIGNIVMVICDRHRNDLPINSMLNVYTDYALEDLQGELSCYYPFVVTDISVERGGLQVLGVEEGMDPEEAGRILRKRGYRHFDERSYLKGGVRVDVFIEEGKVYAMYLSLRSLADLYK